MVRLLAHFGKVPQELLQLKYNLTVAPIADTKRPADRPMNLGGNTYKKI